MFPRASTSSPVPWPSGARSTALVLLAMVLAARAVSAQGSPSPEAGVWIDHTGQGAVEIAACGNKLCGRIFWLKEQNNAKGQPLIDIYNPDASKRKRSICGLPVLGNLQKQAGGAWGAGWVYDPKDGKSYDLEIMSAGRDRLTVTGYMGTKFFGKSMTWTRAPVKLPRCGALPQTEASRKGSGPAMKGKVPAGPAPTSKAAAGSTGQNSPKQVTAPDKGILPKQAASAAGPAATKPTGPTGEAHPREPTLITGPVLARPRAATEESAPAVGAAKWAQPRPPEDAEATTEPPTPTRRMPEPTP